jgi:hypothetical protein
MATTRARPDGLKGKLIVEVDLFEVSHTSTPAHAATRALDWKSVGTPDSDRINWGAIIEKAFEDARQRVDRDITLREKAQRIAREHAPVQIATFEVG